MWDAIRLEKEGIATFLVVHDIFADAARRQASAGGLAGLRLLVYPQPPPGESEEQARSSARQIAEAIESLLGLS